MKIEVTQEDIAHGIPRDGSCCPIARAINRQYPDFGLTFVCEFEIETEDFDYATPDAATKFILAFDRGDVVQPFSFDLDEQI